MCVVPQPRARWQLLQQLRIPAAEDHIVRDESGLEPLGDVENMARPALAAEALQAGGPDILLVRAPLLVGQMRELHGLEDPVDDQRAAETGSETQEQHPSAR